jgi:hypothetical protein
LHPSELPGAAVFDPVGSAAQKVRRVCENASCCPVCVCVCGGRSARFALHADAAPAPPRPWTISPPGSGPNSLWRGAGRGAKAGAFWPSACSALSSPAPSSRKGASSRRPARKCPPWASTRPACGQGALGTARPWSLLMGTPGGLRPCSLPRPHTALPAGPSLVAAEGDAGGAAPEIHCIAHPPHCPLGRPWSLLMGAPGGQRPNSNSN